MTDLTDTDLADADVAQLPPTLRRIVKAIGLAATLRLLELRGGQRIRNAIDTPSPQHELFPTIDKDAIPGASS